MPLEALPDLLGLDVTAVLQRQLDCGLLKQDRIIHIREVTERLQCANFQTFSALYIGKQNRRSNPFAVYFHRNILTNIHSYGT